MRLLILTSTILVAAPLAGAHSQHPPSASAPASPRALAQIREVERALAPLASPEAARAAGFEPVFGWLPMMGTHWVHGPRMMAAAPGNITLEAPAQLMFSAVDGKDTLVGAAYAYYAPPEAPAPPAVFDGAPPWHDHPDLAPPGMNLVMLHVWFVASPDGPFAGFNPLLPYWAAGARPPEGRRPGDPAASRALRTGALALAEIVKPTGLFPVLARRPAVKAVLDDRRQSIRAIVPELEAARRAGDTGRWDALVGDLGRHWTAIREAYLASALDPDVRARIARAIDEMTAPHGHDKHPPAAEGAR